MRAAPFAILTGLLPLLCIHLCYGLAASNGHVPWCIPYWDSCTSISATGRELPEKLLFKLIMMPAAVLAILFWWWVAGWLRQVAERHSRAVWLNGLLASVFLLLYVAALGEGRDYQTLRKIGIVLFFSLTFLAQLIFLWHCSRAAGRLQRYAGILRVQFALALMLLGIGIASVVLDLLYARYDDIEDAFEWVMMLFIVGQFISHYGLWRKAGLRLNLSCESI